MNRKDFFRKFGLIATAAIVAPTVVKALVEEPKPAYAVDTCSGEAWKVDSYDQRHLGAQGIFPGEYTYKDGGLYPKSYDPNGPWYSLYENKTKVDPEVFQKLADSYRRISIFDLLSFK